jgi:SepF-like predicted cell division protein (DUF552 family)
MGFLDFLKTKQIDNDFYKKDNYEKSKSYEEYITIEDINPIHKEKTNSKLKIKVFSLENHMDTRNILERIRDKNTICLINIRILRDKDAEELKRSIDKLKRTADALGGDVVSFSSDWVLASPENIEIERRERKIHKY